MAIEEYPVVSRVTHAATVQLNSLRVAGAPGAGERGRPVSGDPDVPRDCTLRSVLTKRPKSTGRAHRRRAHIRSGSGAPPPGLGLPDTWLLAQARAGRIPHHRLGHYVRLDVG